MASTGLRFPRVTVPPIMCAAVLSAQVIQANSAAMPGHRISVSRDAFQTLRRLYHEACQLREEYSYQITVLISVEVD
ncbi:hypothetical protein DTO217A2_8808 [Paecilomyces variotii]|nr:hypothetical protein DTO217A2_8808 [Paecilomyces variotii]KAJ9388468.1 hypothetical protein DTO063F5_2799 [Paecilomyces variotii]KAJ9400236.1 hypothetical protein DTO282F9_2704 [Paecilomyces variotii]